MAMYSVGGKEFVFYTNKIERNLKIQSYSGCILISNYEKGKKWNVAGLRLSD